MRRPASKPVRVVRGAVAVSAAVLGLAATGCGGDGKAGADAVEESRALTGLYVIDHGGATPTGKALAPYAEAFARVRAGCEGSPDALASAIQNVASQATNGSGTTVTNLETLRATARAVGDEPQDCAGLLVGVEARLEGGRFG